MKRIAVLSIIVLGLVAPAGARAMDFTGWGPRLGATLGPDQVHFGAHVDFLDSSRRFRIEPNVELGLGDDLTLLALNGDVAYRFNTSWDAWSPFVGGGLGLFVVGNEGQGVFEDSNTDLGVSGLFGVDRTLGNGSRFFVLGKVGIVDAPDFKITAGWEFHH